MRRLHKRLVAFLATFLLCDDEILLPPALARSPVDSRALRVVPVNEPLFPGHPPQQEAWTEFRYWAHCFVMPGREVDLRP